MLVLDVCKESFHSSLQIVAYTYILHPQLLGHRLTLDTHVCTHSTRVLSEAVNDHAM